VRFLDHWLRGRETGVMRAPKLRAYIEEWSEPSPWRDPAPGRWVGEASWPSPSNTYRSLWLGERGLSETPEPSSDPPHSLQVLRRLGSGRMDGLRRRRGAADRSAL
jgi:predicted acyl esterase